MLHLPGIQVRNRKKFVIVQRGSLVIELIFYCGPLCTSHPHQQWNFSLWPFLIYIPFLFNLQSTVNFLTAPSVLFQHTTLMLVHLFVCVTLLLVLNLYAPHVHLVRPTVLMASAVIRVPPTWNQHVLALVLLRSLFPSMLVKKFVPISPTLLLPTRQLKVLKPVLWRWVYHLRSLLGMVPTHRIWCGVNALHLTMANWTFMNPLSLPCMSSMALVLLCLSSGPCTNACVKRLVQFSFSSIVCHMSKCLIFSLLTPRSTWSPFQREPGTTVDWTRRNGLPMTIRAPLILRMKRKHPAIRWVYPRAPKTEKKSSSGLIIILHW